MGWKAKCYERISNRSGTLSLRSYTLLDKPPSVSGLVCVGPVTERRASFYGVADYWGAVRGRPQLVDERESLFDAPALWKSRSNWNSGFFRRMFGCYAVPAKSKDL